MMRCRRCFCALDEYGFCKARPEHTDPTLLMPSRLPPDVRVHEVDQILQELNDASVVTMVRAQVQVGKRMYWINMPLNHSEDRFLDFPAEMRQVAWDDIFAQCMRQAQLQDQLVVGAVLLPHGNDPV